MKQKSFKYITYEKKVKENPLIFFMKWTNNNILSLMYDTNKDKNWNFFIDNIFLYTMYQIPLIALILYSSALREYPKSMITQRKLLI